MVLNLIMCGILWYFLFLSFFEPFVTHCIVFKIYSHFRPAVYKNDSLDKILMFCKKHFVRGDGC